MKIQIIQNNEDINGCQLHDLFLCVRIVLWPTFFLFAANPSCTIKYFLLLFLQISFKNLVHRTVNLFSSELNTLEIRVFSLLPFAKLFHYSCVCVCVCVFLHDNSVKKKSI